MFGFSEIRRIIGLGVAIVWLGGCTTWDPEPRDPRLDGLARRYTRTATAAVEAPDRWWESFGSAALNRLMEQALHHNLDLAGAWTRLRQAEITAALAGAGRSPAVIAEGERSSSTRIDAGKLESTNSFSFGFMVSYEVDLWGRVRAGIAAADLHRRASRSDLEATALTLSGSIADAWIQLLATNTEIGLVKAQIATHRRRLEILRNRQRKGLAAALDVYQQEQTLAAAAAQLPTLLQVRELLRNQLALLRGRNPGGTTETFGSRLPQLPPFPELGVPADLLARRPDIKASFLRLRAADWDVTAARAARLPALSLTASATAEAEHLDALFDDWLARLAAGLTAPLLDGGRRRAEVERTRAVVQERLWSYRRTVLNAVHEVEAAIITEQHQLDLRRRTQQQLDLARKTLAEAEKRYRNQLVDYLTVLTSTVAVQRLERDLLRLDATLCRNRITLYKAVGGGLPSSLKPPSKPERKPSFP